MSSSSHNAGIIPPVNQKSQLINVREFKQTYEDLLKTETQVKQEEQHELGVAHLAMLNVTTTTTPSLPQHQQQQQQNNNSNNNIGGQQQQQHEYHQFNNPTQFLLVRPEQWNAYDCSDLLMPTPYDIIEKGIKEQIEKSKINDGSYSGNPSKIAQETGLLMDEIPTITHIEQQQQSSLLSLTYVF